MALLGGFRVNATLRIASSTNFGSERTSFSVGSDMAQHFWNFWEKRAPVTYEGPVVMGGETFNGRVEVSVFNVQDIPGGGAVVTILASGPPERI
jgi:hypothetical protein